MAYETIILLAAKKAAVSGMLLLAICTHESRLKNVLVERDGDSPTFGICQIKYETAKMMGFSGKEKDLMIPQINAKWAAIYLKFQFDRYDENWHMAAAAYNSGSYNESKKVPGCPRNLKYINKVKENLPKTLRSKMKCGNDL